MNPTCSPDCWRCGVALGDFTHIFWTCPYILGFWMEVVALLNFILHAHMPVSMSVCLLGFVKDILSTEAERTFANITLSYARKAIALYWKKPYPPTLVYRKQLVNNSLPLHRDTYVNRGCPRQYEKIWAKWLEEPYAASPNNISF